MRYVIAAIDANARIDAVYMPVSFMLMRYKECIHNRSVYAKFEEILKVPRNRVNASECLEDGRRRRKEARIGCLSVVVAAEAIKIVSSTTKMAMLDIRK